MNKQTRFFYALLIGLVLFTTIYVVSPPRVGASSVVSNDKTDVEQTTIPNSDTYIVEFLAPNAVLLPNAAREAIGRAMNIWPDAPPENNTFYLIGLRWEHDWALATLTSANLNEPLNSDVHTHLDWGNLIALILVKTETGWQAAIDVDNNIETLLELVPIAELDQRGRDAIFPPPDQIRTSVPVSSQYANYLFPWPAGNPWRMSNINGWHGTGGEIGNNSLDFDINSPHTNSDILAAASGVVTYMCEGAAEQYYLRIVTDGTTERFGYLHLDGVTVRAEGITQGVHVEQGQKLGRMWEGTGGDACGFSYGTHIHLHFPTKPFIIDGITFTESNIHWGEDLYSSNPPDSTPPSLNFPTIPNQSQWYNTDQPLIFSAEDNAGGSGVYRLLWAWDNPTPATEIIGSSGSTSLLAAGTEGKHWLYVQACDEAGNCSAVQSRGWFGYDITSPSGNPNINQGQTVNNINVPLISNGLDAVSGIATALVSNDGVTYQPLNYAPTVIWSILGLNRNFNPVWVKLVDFAGNESDVYSLETCLDLYPAPPSSDSYRLWSAGPHSAGGGSTSTSYQLNQIVGQTPSGNLLTSFTYQLQSGFLSTWDATPSSFYYRPFVCGQSTDVYLPIIVR